MTVELYAVFNIGDKWRYVVNPTSRLLYPQEREPVTTVQETEQGITVSLEGLG
jgi:hypothetical protein